MRAGEEHDMGRKVCDIRTDLGATIKLIQAGVNRFEVHYGKQVDEDLDYEQAAAKYGEAVMHALACEGRLDNRERGEI